MEKRASARADVEETAGRAPPYALDHGQTLRERQLPAPCLRDEQFVCTGSIAFEHGIGTKTRRDVLQPALRALDKLLAQRLVTRAAEGACQLSGVGFARIPAGSKNPDVSAAAEIAGDFLEKAGIQHRRSIRKT
jgi:hypothetical protein